MRIFQLFILIGAGTILGLLYGIVHDEITFSISPEFYLKVRFEQMKIEPGTARLGVAQVAAMNILLYSFIISTVLSVAGIIHSDTRKSLSYTLQSFLISISIAFLFGLAGWMIAKISVQDFDNVKLPENIIDVKQFKAVQLIHNFSYMGGIIGMLIGLGWQFYCKKKDTNFFGRKTDDI